MIYVNLEGLNGASSTPELFKITHCALHPTRGIPVPIAHGLGIGVHGNSMPLPVKPLRDTERLGFIASALGSLADPGSFVLGEKPLRRLISQAVLRYASWSTAV